jgi:hypothetical protein
MQSVTEYAEQSCSYCSYSHEVITRSSLHQGPTSPGFDCRLTRSPSNRNLRGGGQGGGAGGGARPGQAAMTQHAGEPTTAEQAGPVIAICARLAASGSKQECREQQAGSAQHNLAGHRLRQVMPGDAR